MCRSIHPLFSLVLCAALSATASADLVSYWNFDGDTLDQHGLNHGTAIGTSYNGDVSPAVGFGSSLQLTGPGSHVNVLADPSLNSSVFTLSYWIKDPGQLDGVGVSTSSGHNRIFSRGSDSFELGVSNAPGGSPADTSRIKFYSPSTGWVTTSATTDPAQWMHVAYVSNGSSLTVYANGSAVHTQGAFVNPTGAFFLGARANAVTPNEGFTGLIDDVALWNDAYPQEAILSLTSGTFSPTTLPPPPPPPPPPTPFATVVSNLDWRMSTESIDGGPNGTWSPSGASPPDTSTFTLTPTATHAALMPHINNAATSLGAIGLAGDNNVHYYRTTFELPQFTSIEATIQFAADNGGEIWVNGQKLATEVSFVVDNWTAPLPSVSIAADGSVVTTKFDTAAATFAGFVAGENEIIVALRNPNAELNPAGAFALKMDVAGTPIPEPSTVALVGMGLAMLGTARARRRTP
jgi:hypothetical protein